MVKCSPHRPKDLAGHVIPAAVFASSRPAGARSAARPQESDPRSADPPVATGTEPAKQTRHKPLDPGDQLEHAAQPRWVRIGVARWFGVPPWTGNQGRRTMELPDDRSPLTALPARSECGCPGTIPEGTGDGRASQGSAGLASRGGVRAPAGRGRLRRRHSGGVKERGVSVGIGSDDGIGFGYFRAGQALRSGHSTFSRSDRRHPGGGEERPTPLPVGAVTDVVAAQRRDRGSR